MTLHSNPPTDELSVARSLDQRLVAARKAQRGAEHQLAVLLTEMAAGGFRTLGYASIQQYATTVLDLPPRTARDLLRIGYALPSLPNLDRALADGALDWTKAREILRVATPDNEAGWVERAQCVSARVIEQEVACAVRGDPAPVGSHEPEREPIRRRVCFDMETCDAEVLRQALALLRIQSDLDPSEIEDGALLASMARTIVQGAESWYASAADLEDDTGGSPSGATDAAASPGGHANSPSGSADPRGSMSIGERYRIVVQQCPSCGHMDAPDGEVSDTIAVEACCDAEIVDMRPGPNQGHATRTIRPALRRRVFHRAGWTCEVPNCRNKLFLDVHHTDPWAQSHSHVFEKLLVTCDAHHRAIHSGGLAVELGKDDCVCVEHADGRRYVGRPRVRR